MQVIRKIGQKTKDLGRPLRLREAEATTSAGDIVWGVAKRSARVAAKGVAAVLKAFRSDDDWWRFSPMQW